MVSVSQSQTPFVAPENRFLTGTPYHFVVTAMAHLLAFG